MLNYAVFALLLATPPQVERPGPPPECELEVLTPTAFEERAIAEFNQGVEQYVRLHRRFERRMPPEQMFDDPERTKE